MALNSGQSYVWKDIIINIDGVPFAEAKAITYTSSQEKALNYGQGAKPTSVGFGRKNYEGSLTLSLADVESLRETAPNRDLLDLPPFSITVTWAPTGGGLPVNHILKSVCLTEDPLAVAEGDTDIPVELAFIFGDIQK